MTSSPNPEHVRIVKAGAEELADWIERTDGGQTLDLCGADLSHQCLANLNLVAANLADAKLDDADLSGARLSAANLSNADLSNADLTGTKLNHAVLVAATLSGAKLIDANLTFANLSEFSRTSSGSSVHSYASDLSEADLTGVNLTRANLAHANLTGTILTRATFAMTTIGGLDLSNAVGLEEVVHTGPCSLDLGTLMKSKGRIPDVFLKGCGLANWEIENAKLYDPELTPSQINDIHYHVHELRVEGPIQFYSVFISHSSKDKEFARELHDALDRKGIRCWLDEKQILPGDDIRERIDHGIKNWDKLILCCSEAALVNSWWVESEVNRVFDREIAIRKNEGRKVMALVPIDLDGHVFNWDHELKADVLSRRVGDFTAWGPRKGIPNDALDELIRALRLDDAGREPKPPKLL